MAKQQVVSYSYTCDVCGTSIAEEDRDSASRKVSWEGTAYVLDVCSTHASQLDEVLGNLKGFVDAGQRSGGRRGRRPAMAASTSPRRAKRSGASSTASSSDASPKRGDIGAIRAWAQQNGHKVGDRGRIPASVLAAYETATSTSEPAAAPRRGRPRKKATA